MLPPFRSQPPICRCLGRKNHMPLCCAAQCLRDTTPDRSPTPLASSSGRCVASKAHALYCNDSLFWPFRSVPSFPFFSLRLVPLSFPLGAHILEPPVPANTFAFLAPPLSLIHITLLAADPPFKRCRSRVHCFVCSFLAAVQFLLLPRRIACLSVRTLTQHWPASSHNPPPRFGTLFEGLHPLCPFYPALRPPSTSHRHRHHRHHLLPPSLLPHPFILSDPPPVLPLPAPFFWLQAEPSRVAFGIASTPFHTHRALPRYIVAGWCVWSTRTVLLAPFSQLSPPTKQQEASFFPAYAPTLLKTLPPTTVQHSVFLYWTPHALVFFSNGREHARFALYT
jgi:hypothetical protein